MTGLRRTSWDDFGLHGITIGLQWYADKLFQPHHDNEWPFLGIYVPAQGQERQRRRSLADALADVRSALKGKATGDWLYWRYVRPTDGADQWILTSWPAALCKNSATYGPVLRQFSRRIGDTAGPHSGQRRGKSPGYRAGGSIAVATALLPRAVSGRQSDA